MHDVYNEQSVTDPLMEKVLYEIKKVVIGQDHFLERVLVSVLAGGSSRGRRGSGAG